MCVRGTASGDVYRDAIHWENPGEQRRIDAPLRIDDRHPGQVRPLHRHTTHLRRCPMHLRARAARCEEGDVCRLLRIGCTAQRIQAPFQHPDVLRRIQLALHAHAIDLHARLLRQTAQPRKAEVHRRKQSSVRRSVFVRLHGKRQIRSTGRHGQQIPRKRAGDHVKPVDKHMHSAEHTRCSQLVAHQLCNVLSVGQLTGHPRFIRRKQARRIGQLAARGAVFLHLRETLSEVLRRHPAALEIGNKRAQLLHKTRRAALRRGAVHRQVLLLRFDDLGEHHALAPLVEDHAVRLSRALKDAALQSGRREHVDQE